MPSWKKFTHSVGEVVIGTLDALATLAEQKQRKDRAERIAMLLLKRAANSDQNAIAFLNAWPSDGTYDWSADEKEKEVISRLVVKKKS